MTDGHVYPSAQRLVERVSSRRTYRSLVLLSVSVVAGLATAGPALAADEPMPPEASAIVVPEPVAPPIPVPTLSPELMEPPVVVTQVDAENIDVSVRVLSPGDEGTVTQESTTAVVSPIAEADITAPPESAQPPETTTAAQSGATNTNVSIRVLSPGDNGKVDQDNSGGGDEVVVVGAAPGPSRPDAATTSATTPGAQLDSLQYQDGNSRYQSADQIPTDSWNWRWFLTLDCAGNAASSSTETGYQDSLVWSWEWVWEWGCSDVSPTEASPASPDSSPPPAVAGKPPNEGTSSADPGPTAVEPWVWTWTFAFCGETRTISTRAGLGTPLTWTWDWSWTWSCGGATTAAVAPPLPTIPSPPLAIAPPASSETETDPIRSLQAVAGAPALELPTVWRTGPAELEADWTPGLALPLMAELPVAITVEVAIPPVVLPVPTAPSPVPPEIPFQSGGGAAEPATTSPTLPRAEPADLPASGSTAVRAAYPQARPRGHQARPAKEPRAQDKRPSRAHDRQLPLERRQPRQAAGSPSAGGVMPSALLLGVAALTGFVLLAAPGLGRRIRLARLLRPRGLDRSPIDHPG